MLKKLMTAIIGICVCVIIISITLLEIPNGHIYKSMISGIFYSHPTISTTEKKTPSQDNADFIKNLSYYYTQTVPLRNVSRLFYTRVPKCASTSTISLLRNLKVMNKFSYPADLATVEVNQQVLRSCKSCKAELGFPWERAVTEYMTNQTKPTLLSDHVVHIDFPLFMDGDFPVHFSMIRDPLNRHVSQFYYHQKIRKLIPHINVPPSSVTYDDCVQGDIAYCTNHTFEGYFNIIPYFCGIQANCHHENDQALQIAKSNLMKDYAVVGLTEYYSESLQLLETILPEHFSGVMNLYGTKRTILNVAGMNATLNNSTITKMKSLLKMEYEFYHFVKQRFFTQYQTIFKRSLKY